MATILILATLAADPGKATSLSSAPQRSLWVFELIEGFIPAVQRLMQQQFGEYLTQLKDEAYRDQVIAYVEKEDTPRPLVFQLDLLREVGFRQVEVLHKNVCFAALGAVKD